MRVEIRDLQGTDTYETLYTLAEVLPLPTQNVIGERGTYHVHDVRWDLRKPQVMILLTVPNSGWT